MSSNLGVMSSLGVFAPAVERRTADYSEIYSQNCHRIYSLAFWMTDNELTAEQLSASVFLRAFAATSSPTVEQIDQALLAEIREITPVGTLSLNRAGSSATSRVYGNVKRIHLERAVVQLPATEKLIFLFHDVEGYEHEQISRLLGINERESQFGLHQARVQLRELILQMQ